MPLVISLLLLVTVYRNTPLLLSPSHTEPLTLPGRGCDDQVPKFELRKGYYDHMIANGDGRSRVRVP
eukprot:763598-Hanusia_phi.AAC.7